MPAPVQRLAANRPVRDVNSLKRSQMREFLKGQATPSGSRRGAVDLIFHSVFHKAVYLVTTNSANLRFRDSETSASTSEKRGP